MLFVVRTHLKGGPLARSYGDESPTQPFSYSDFLDRINRMYRIFPRFIAHIPPRVDLYPVNLVNPAKKKRLEGLFETGLCMLDFGQTRPASGSEHHISHFWEMKLLLERRPAILHGAKVEVAQS
jgi:hypothetical protein